MSETTEQWLRKRLDVQDEKLDQILDLQKKVTRLEVLVQVGAAILATLSGVVWWLLTGQAVTPKVGH